MKYPQHSAEPTLCPKVSEGNLRFSINRIIMMAGSDMETATYDVINSQLEQVMTSVKAGELNVENIDVFCEKGVFEISQSRRIMEAGREAGLRGEGCRN